MYNITISIPIFTTIIAFLVFMIIFAVASCIQDENQRKRIERLEKYNKTYYDTLNKCYNTIEEQRKKLKMYNTLLNNKKNNPNWWEKGE